MGHKFIANSRKEVFSVESSKVNFNQVCNSAIEIFFVGGRMGAGCILSKSCYGKPRKIHKKTSATVYLFN